MNPTVALRNFMGAQAPGAPMLPMPEELASYIGGSVQDHAEPWPYYLLRNLI
jgi:hypothetical protein